MSAVLFAIPASPPCAVAERVLELKGIPYRRVERVPVASRVIQRVRFGTTRVPVVQLDDGTRINGSRAIVHALDERVAEPAVLPVDGDARARVERAEEWGDEVLQSLMRRVFWATLKRAPGSLTSYSEGARVPVPDALAGLGAPVLARLAAKVNGADDLSIRADLLALPAHLDRIDHWIADGTLGGDAVNAADLQVGANLRLLLTLGDLAPLIDARPAGALARRVFARYPGSAPDGVLPPAWLPPVSGAGASP